MSTKEVWVSWSMKKKSKPGPRLGQASTVPTGQIQEHLQAIHLVLIQTHLIVCKISSALN